jgi:hypothetical protein
MKEIKEDVIKMWDWAEGEFDPEEVHRLKTEVDFAINNLNRYINNEFKRKAMGKTDMRSK